MNIVDSVREEREDLASVLKKHKGIRKIVEDLYPDSAHFIFELLQNAEDTDASRAEFTLTKEALIFEHDGRAFDKRDLEGITDIGDGTKSDDEDKIGQYGVGFKAVFAYSETPCIYSPTLSFRISDLVLPYELENNPSLGKKTRFVFKFNNPKKSPEVAYKEIKEGLDRLPDTTILFLRSIKAIGWSIELKKSEISRVKHADHHIEVMKIGPGHTKSSSHFLVFEEPVVGLNKHHLAVAYELDFLPKSEGFVGNKPLNKQMKLVPASPGRVSVFFPAEKETSGLRFHLHAPFVPELSRASIKDTEANTPLYLQLANAVKKSLYVVKDMGLFANDFLGILPNSEDSLPVRYSSIREAVISEMNNNPLVPTHGKGFAPGNSLLQARLALKNLLSSEDLAFLEPMGEERTSWAIGTNQRNPHVDHLLSDLNVLEWDVDELIDAFTHSTFFYASQSEDFYSWLDTKDDLWIQQLYSIFEKEIESSYYTKYLDMSKFVRLESGKYSSPKSCFFPDEEGDDDIRFPRVSKNVLNVGDDDNQKELARRLLERLGVKHVGELEKIKLILEERYTEDAEVPSSEQYRDDINRFIRLVENNSSIGPMFSDYYIFNRSDDHWSLPSATYLDLPYLDSGLYEVFSALDLDVYPVSNLYKELGIDDSVFVAFAKKVGVMSSLAIKKVSCLKNQNYSYLSSVPGQVFTSSGKDEDYTISGLQKLCNASSINISRILWRLMARSRPYLKARYSKNASNGSRYSESQLVQTLMSEPWVPQGDEIFVKPSDATKELLPEGFAYDASLDWLKAVNFGTDHNKSVEEQIKRDRIAEEIFGTSKKEDIDRIRRVAELPKEILEQFLDEYNARRNYDLPVRESSNPERRKEKVLLRAMEAGEKEVEIKRRTVQVGVSDVKLEADAYLRNQYTNTEEDVICQICKDAMPFKLSDGSYYIEKVEFIKGLSKRYPQNYLALCPNHAAMFLYANEEKEQLSHKLSTMEGNDLVVSLAGQECSIYFTRIHSDDIQTVLEAEGSFKSKSEAGASNPSGNDDVYSESHSPDQELLNGSPVSLIDGEPHQEFNGVNLPAGLDAWKKAYLYARDGAWVIATRKMAVAKFLTKEQAESWWGEFSEYRGILGAQIQLSNQ